MRLLVCFKVTPDYEALREADWAAAEAGRPRTRYVRRVLNCFDESALELALRLADAAAGTGQGLDLGALSVGGREAEPYLRTLLALGYGRAARVRPGTEADFVPALTAALVAEYARRVDRSDVVLLGARSGPGDSGTVPSLVADTLGWPCFGDVVDLEAASPGRLRFTASSGDGLLRATVRPPCVLVVGNAVVSHLRAPTLSDRLARKNVPVGVLEAADLGVDVAGEVRRTSAALTGLERIDRGRPGVLVGGETSRDQARALFDGHLSHLIGDL